MALTSQVLLISGAVCFKKKRGKSEFYLFVLRSKPDSAQARGLVPCRLSCDKATFEYVTNDVKYPVRGAVTFRTTKQDGKVNHHVTSLLIREKESEPWPVMSSAN